jgi:hypothetical protein
MEHGEVQRKTKSDWIASVQGLRCSRSLLVTFESSVFDSLQFLVSGALSNISIVVTNHLVEKGFGLVSGSNFHALRFDDFYNGNALIIELAFDLFLIVSKTPVEF